ncbi:MAG TPA: DNA internalization-related competence protein ComEC/Rec2 [Pseudogracilibacillus sp.]|nr:DNA internalization-related competence protein ComEC/Rec2 [Pseudogracilibacillus sp.]
MTNKWYIIAYSALCSILSIMTKPLFIGGFFIFTLFYYLWKKQISFILFCLAILTYISFLYYLPTVQEAEESRRQVDINKSNFEGYIVSSVSTSDKTRQFIFKEVKSTAKFQVVLFLQGEDEIEDLYYHDYCNINGTLEEASRATNPFEFDYDDYLLKQNIIYTLKVDDQANLLCKRGQNHLLSKLDQVKSLWLSKLQAVYRAETFHLILALVFGNDQYIDEMMEEQFRKWGLSHILAISGLHVGIVVYILYSILLKTRLFTVNRIQTILIILLPIYAFLAGGEPSVWRASTMIVLYLLLSKFKLRLSQLDIISIVFLIVILLNKWIIYQVGFQFSFLVSVSLIISTAWLRQSQSKLYQLFLISFISQMVILPIQIHYFHTFNPLSIILNIIVVPYFSLLVIPLMFLFACSFVLPQFILSFVDDLFNISFTLFTSLLQFVDAHFYYPLHIGSFPFYFAFIYYCCLAAFFMFQEQLHIKRAIYAASLCLASIFVLLIKPYLSPYGYMTMLNIGQGDAIVIELPYRRGVFFIDVGSTVNFETEEASDRVYKQIIEKYLLGRGISQIDAVFLSHNHLDHTGSLQYMLEDLPVKSIMTSPYFTFEQDPISNHQVVKTGDRLTIQPYSFHVLSPSKDYRDENSNSLVLYTELGGARWLFTGDLTAVAEKDLINAYSNLKVDFLKIAHHGSDTSTTEAFLSAVQPQIAFIPVGENNRYNHPHQDIIDRLEERNIHIYRTDEDGAIQVKFSQDQIIKIKTYN